ncbi:MAG: hypothetical protein ACTHV4_08910 [Canibacter sp.]
MNTVSALNALAPVTAKQWGMVTAAQSSPATNEMSCVPRAQHRA